MFVRTILAMSLSCIFAGTTFAASTAEQPLNPQVISNTAVEDPIDPLATEASAAQSTLNATDTAITQQEQNDLNKASQTLDDLHKTEDTTADVGAAPTTTTPSQPVETTTTAAPKASWTLDGLNNAT